MEKLSVSKFNICFKGLQEKGRFVYNTLSTSMLEIDDVIFNAISQMRIPDIPEESLNLLKDQGFLVQADADEAREYLYYYNRTRFGETSKILKIVVIPTYSCNLACGYCLQGKGEKNNLDEQASSRMDTKKADRILTFIENQISLPPTSIPVERLHISFHGGEPLVAFDICDYFADKVTAIGKAHNIKPAFTMASNLTLLNSNVLSFIKKNDVSVQVTIDGTKQQHDTRRRYRNGKGTYDIILQNMSMLVEQGLKDNIVIRLNIDSETIKSAAETMNQVRHFSDDIYFSALRPFKGKNESYRSKCLDSSCEVSQESFLAEIYQMNELETPASFGKKGPCSLNCENKYYVDPYLDVYKCELLIGQPEYRIGNIDESGTIRYSQEFYNQMSWGPDRFEKCVNCVLLPCCAGGCPATGVEAEGNLMNAECQLGLETLVGHLRNYLKR
jgi:uncharacterized protein